MTRYIKDEINFHGFLTAMRQLHGVTLEQVCEGLCSISMMKRIESGERLPDKLTRDRLMLRMGVALEGYEDYLSMEEYKEWQNRQKIILSINERRVDQAKKYLEEYQKKEDLSRVEQQFVKAIEFMFLKMGDAPRSEQKIIIEKAVQLTISDIERALSGDLLLSEQEINLITEYLWLHEDNEEAVMDNYQRLLTYIISSHMDYNGRAKTYPKTEVYLCRKILEKNVSLESLQKGLKISYQAIKILRDSEKAYYFVELLEIWQELAEKMQLLLRKTGKDVGADILIKQAEEKKEWEKLFKALYTEYNVAVYMENFCYLYWETESYCIGDVIRARRNMLGLTKEQLCEGICSLKTLTRIELKKAKTQMPIVRELFERLGLCAEYTRARVITNDYETLKLADELAVYMNNERVKEWENTLKELRNRLCMNIPQNRQFIESGYYLLGLHTGKLAKEEFIDKMLETLEYTIPLSSILKGERNFFTRDEASCLYNVGMRIETEGMNVYLQAIEEICKDYEINGITAHISLYEFFRTGLCSYLGNIGQYELSNRLSKKVIKEGLTYHRIGLVAKNIYNIFWNNQQRKEAQKNSNDTEREKLQQCILLSKIFYRENAVRFYREMLVYYYDEKHN